MQEERAFMIWSLDKSGDHHLFATDDLERATTAYHTMKERHGNALANEGLSEAVDLVSRE